MKKVTWFFLLHPAPFYGQDYEKQTSPGTTYLSLWVVNMFKKINFLVRPFESGNWEGKKKKHWISQEQKKLVRENKNHFFIIFETLFLVKSKKIEVNPNCPRWGHIVPTLSVFWPLCFNGKSFEILTFPLIFLISRIICPHRPICWWPSITVAYYEIVDSLLHRLGFKNWM